MDTATTVQQFQEMLRQRGRSDRTVRAAGRTAALFLEWLGGREPTGSPSEIDAFLAEQRTRRHWSPATEQDARTALHSFLRYLGHSTSMARGTSPFAEWLQERHRMAPGTARIYQHWAQHFANWWVSRHGQPFAAAQVSAADVEAYWTEQIASHPASLRPLRAALCYLAEWLKETEGAVLPLGDLPLPEPLASTRRVSWLSPEEEHRLVTTLARRMKEAEPGSWESSEALRDLALCLLLLDAGLTPGEAAALPKSAVDLQGHRITVTGSKEVTRVVPLTERLAKLLARQMDHPSLFLFPSQRSAHLTARAVQHRVAAWREMTGLTGLTAYTLRHTFIRRRLEGGMSDADVATLAGLTRQDGKPLLWAVRLHKPNG